MTKDDDVQPHQEKFGMEPTQWQLDKIKEIKNSNFGAFRNMPQATTYDEAASILSSFIFTKANKTWNVLVDNKWTRHFLNGPELLDGFEDPDVN